MSQHEELAIAHAAYIKFANKYNIPLTKTNGSKKLIYVIPELAKDIYNYEMRYIYPKYGLYVVK